MRRSVSASAILLRLGARLVLGGLPLLGGSPANAGEPARPARTGSLLWPLEIPGLLLSSFGEYRYDHLHAGIDISTQGGTGYEVRAAASGAIYRLKVEWRGYGRALYIRHPGGRITVYGHLERYEDAVLRLERRVARRQAEARTRYPGDIYLDPPLPVRRGQVVAFSGESGVGLPHLHFEVRDGEDAPIDPFAAGLRPPQDQRRPVLESLTITAAAPGTFIDGVLREKIHRFPGGATGAAGQQPVRVSGPFLAALSAYDPAGTDGRAGVRSVELRIDGRVWYRLAPRSFRFEQYPQSGLIFDHRGSRLGPARFLYRLERLPGNELASAGREVTGPAWGDACPWAIDLEPGAHHMEITASDASGNVARASICLLMGRPGAPRVEAWGPARDATLIRFALADETGAGGAPDAAAPGCAAVGRSVEGEAWTGPGERFLPLACSLRETSCLLPKAASQGEGPRAVRLRELRDGVPGPWTIVPPSGSGPAAPRPDELSVEAWPGFLDVTLPLEGPVVPDLRLVGRGGEDALARFAYRDGFACAAAVDYRRAAGEEPLAIARAPGQRLAGLDLDSRYLGPLDALDYRGPGFSVAMPAGGRFFPGPLLVRTLPTAGEPRLPAVSDAVDLLPEGEALDRSASLSFDLTGAILDPASLGIYRWDASRSRWAYEGGEVDDSGRSMSLKFRRYGRFALLQDASPPVVTEVTPAPETRGVPRRPPISAAVEEEGKGLNYDGVSFVLDGRTLESEFDPDRARARVLEVPRLTPGPHHLRVTATDLAGNVSEPVEVAFEVR